ncbi:uncharacterized membrane protein YraQ (UPF0718 family) [Enterococcus rivorum]|nr:uncharacterized membrane protein YraQ (UPF0718 family) [Enterococcus rivorum]
MIWFILLMLVVIAIFSLSIYLNFKTVYPTLKTKNKLLRVIHASLLSVFFTIVDGL